MTDCPLCGKPIPETGQKFCASCRRLSQQQSLLAKTFYPQTPDGKNEKPDESGNQTPLPPKSARRKTRKFFGWLLAILLLGGIATGGYFYYDYLKDKQQEDEAAWQAASKENTPAALLSYLAQHPQGLFVNEAQRLILKSKDDELKAWDITEKSKDETTVSQFISSHSDSPHLEAAKGMLDSILWKKALIQDTQEAFDNYLGKTAKGEIPGVHQLQAKEKSDYYAQMQFVGGTEWEEAADAAERFFDSISHLDFKQLKNILADKVDQFYGLRNASPEDIVAAIKKDMAGRGITSVDYQADRPGLKIAKDPQGFYIVTTAIRKGVVLAGDKKNETTTSCKLKMDKGLKVIAFQEND